MSQHDAKAGRSIRLYVVISIEHMMKCRHPCCALSTKMMYFRYCIQLALLHLFFLLHQDPVLKFYTHKINFVRTFLHLTERSMFKMINLPVMGKTLYGSSDSSGSLRPTSFRAKMRIIYSWSCSRSRIWNRCVSAATRPTSIHIVRFISRIAIL